MGGCDVWVGVMCGCACSFTALRFTTSEDPGAMRDRGAARVLSRPAVRITFCERVEMWKRLPEEEVNHRWQKGKIQNWFFLFA